MLKLFPSDVAPPDEADVAQVLIQQVRLERPRQLGPCLLGLTLWRQLQLEDFFATGIDAADAEVPWSRVAAVLAINRLCAPGSELAIEERWYPSTVLLHILEGKINDSRLYRALDQLLPHSRRWSAISPRATANCLRPSSTSCSTTSRVRYVEGAATANPLLQRGYSRDHRGDCLQVVLAVIVNVDGFPLSYETLDGDRTDLDREETAIPVEATWVTILT